MPLNLSIGHIKIVALLIFAVGAWVPVMGGAWEPMKELISPVELALRPFLVQQAATQHQQLPSWSSYAFQYQGRTSWGSKIIDINAACEPLPSEATKGFLVVFEGGPCYFQVIYDVRAKTFRDLKFNGRA